MPIRFRCQHCSQLMGIARRKAGTMVPCTRCGETVEVPQEDVPDAPRTNPFPPPPVLPGSAPQPVRKAEVPLLDRPDFSEQVEQDGTQGGSSDHLDQPDLSVLGARNPPPIPVPGSPGTPVEYDVEPIDPEQLAPPGYVLSARQVTLLTLGVILVVALAFGGGLFVGKYYL